MASTSSHRRVTKAQKWGIFVPNNKSFIDWERVLRRPHRVFLKGISG